ncbi:endoribonuclease Dicer-like isoform X2 [Varroa destructor]|uniref:Dicer-1 n=1 Tax=Varroa destructor TaxID=109461 RepID=A0A7M7KG83_VARDE|nr:endoribonuclease Dicer-like isoform X2 [Varroa destructor]
MHGNIWIKTETLLLVYTFVITRFGRTKYKTRKQQGVYVLPPSLDGKIYSIGVCYCCFCGQKDPCLLPRGQVLLFALKEQSLYRRRQSELLIVKCEKYRGTKKQATKGNIMPRAPKGGGTSPAWRRPGVAQLRARQNVLLENAQKKYFTPLDFQVELVSEARNTSAGNRVIFVSGQDKAYLIVNLLKELAYQIRPISCTSKKVLIVCKNSEELGTTRLWIEDYTDLPCCFLEKEKDVNTMTTSLQSCGVILTLAAAICYLPAFVQILTVVLDKCDVLLQDDTAEDPTTKQTRFPVQNLDPMKTLVDFVTDRRLHVVGLTSALSGVGSADTARARIQRLEKTWQATATVCNELTVLSKYGPKPIEKVLEYGIYYESHPEYDLALKLIEDSLDFLELFMKAKGNHSEVIQEAMRYPMELAYIFITLGPWCAAEAAQEFLVEVSRSIDNIEWLQDIQISMTTLQIVHTFLQQLHALCRNLVTKTKFDPLNPGARHPDKLVTFLEAVGLYTEPKMLPTQPSEDREGKKTRPHYVPWHEDPTALCGLVIVRHRITALVVNKWLQAIAKTMPKLAFVKSNFIIGQTTLDGDDPKLVAAGLTRQEEVLQKFRFREYNLLITTTATEDTLELPHCNLVVRFDPPESYKSYIVCKAKAKASSKCARYFIMLSQYETAKFTHLFSDYRKMEQLMLERSHRDDITIEGDEGASPADKERFYQPSKKGECLMATLSNAIPIVNRYCARLPSDSLTKLAPIFSISQLDGNRFQCTLRLPVNCPLKELIVGEAMSSPVLAKQAVALKAVEMLHKAKDIDDHLAPLGKDSLKAQLEDQVAPLNEIVPQGAPRPGTTKRRQYYYKEVADTFKGDVTTNRFYLYKMSMKLVCAIPDEQNARAREIYDPAETPRGFGLVSSTRLPALCPFPIYTRSGEVLVEIEEICDTVKTSNEQRKMAEFFHLYVFRDVLRLEKFPMKFDLKNAECGFLVVPITGQSVEWDFVKEIYLQRDFKPQKIEEELRKKFVFNRELFADAVVMPWYRNIDKPQFFYVAQICDDLSPMSGFPDSTIATFDEYYRYKYNINVCNKTQPLLDVDHTSARLNLLTPRYVNRKGITLPASSEETRKAKRENLQQKQILIPELCLVHPFPASLWKKVVCLPCILYRMNYLLLSNEIRLRIVREVNIGTAELPAGFKWEALNFGWTLSEVLEDAANKEIAAAAQKPAREPVSEEKIAEIRKPFIGGLRKEGVELTPAGELVIDTFDPSKVNIPNDEELLEAELRDVEFTRPNFDWKPIPGVDETRVRVGSPSQFETEQEWHMDYETEFVSIDGLPGLGYISAPGMFNINGLSEALVRQRDEDIYDSADEESLLEDMQNPDDVPLPDKQGGGKEDVEYNSLWLSPCSNLQQTKPLEGMHTDAADVCEDLLGLQIQVCKGGKMGINFSTLPLIKRALNYMEAPSEFDINDDSNGLIEDHYVSNEVVFGELLQGRDEMEEAPSELRPIHFDEDVETVGPSPAIILQALTMSNANDGVNLERLETVGDSFLKYAVTNYMYCAYPGVHEGKLSFLRSKQISNVNLYRLGRDKGFAGRMVATKFDPSDNWLPPGFCIPEGLEKAVLDAGMPNNHCNLGQFKEGANADGNGVTTDEFVPYSLLTHHSIPDKSIADCVEALIGAYLVSCGRRRTLEFMTWMGLRVLPVSKTPNSNESGNEANRAQNGPGNTLEHTLPTMRPCDEIRSQFAEVPSPLPSSYDERLLDRLLNGHQSFEEKIGYRFRNKGFLLQAFTHASYHYNTLTDCYQRLEFLGDAVLDYLITRKISRTIPMREQQIWLYVRYTLCM